MKNSMTLLGLIVLNCSSLFSSQTTPPTPTLRTFLKRGSVSEGTIKMNIENAKPDALSDLIENQKLSEALLVLSLKKELKDQENMMGFTASTTFETLLYSYQQPQGKKITQKDAEREKYLDDLKALAKELDVDLNTKVTNAKFRQALGLEALEESAPTATRTRRSSSITSESAHAAATLEASPIADSASITSGSSGSAASLTTLTSSPSSNSSGQKPPLPPSATASPQSSRGEIQENSFAYLQQQKKQMRQSRTRARSASSSSTKPTRSSSVDSTDDVRLQAEPAARHVSTSPERSESARSTTSSSSDSNRKFHTFKLKNIQEVTEGTITMQRKPNESDQEFTERANIVFTLE